eukprot:scaffold1880_cov211-Pinguiococcus_pyrenoidosus.AAC.1
MLPNRARDLAWRQLVPVQKEPFPSALGGAGAEAPALAASALTSAFLPGMGGGGGAPLAPGSGGGSGAPLPPGSGGGIGTFAAPGSGGGTGTALPPGKGGGTGTFPCAAPGRGGGTGTLPAGAWTPFGAGLAITSVSTRPSASRTRRCCDLSSFFRSSSRAAAPDARVRLAARVSSWAPTPGSSSFRISVRYSACAPASGLSSLAASCARAFPSTEDMLAVLVSAGVAGVVGAGMLGMSTFKSLGCGPSEIGADELSAMPPASLFAASFALC